jgi:hypothetical protein
MSATPNTTITPPTNPGARSVEDAVRTWWAPLIGMLGFAFTIGGAYVSQTAMGGDIAAVKAETEQTRSDLHAHEALPGHPEVVRRVELLERATDAQQQELRDLRENMLAVCIATGAKCQERR